MCAKSINCDCVVTRKIKDFEDFDIQAITPADLSKNTLYPPRFSHGGYKAKKYNLKKLCGGKFRRFSFVAKV